MIAFLRGRVREKQPSRMILDVQGVGYELHVPLSTFYQVGEIDSEASLRVHTHVREDALQLFGFATQLEQDIFERLIAITGIGPRVALGVLSGIEPEALIRAVQAGDIARLTTIPGIGKKTAERIGLELRDRLPQLLPADSADEPASGARGDVLSALLNLGYHRPLAEKAVDRVLRAQGDGGFEVTLKAALQELAR